MSGITTDIDREALDWLVRVNDPGFQAWEDWDVWMAADPVHADRAGHPRDRLGRDADLLEAVDEALPLGA